MMKRSIKQIPAWLKKAEATGKLIEGEEVAAVGMIRIMIEQIKAAAIDPEAIKQVTAQLQASRRKLKRVITANTPRKTRSKKVN